MRAHVGAVLLIVGVSAVSYANALQADFFWDDVHIIRRNPGIRDLRNTPRFFVPQYWQEIYADYLGMPGRYYRPIPEVTLAVDYALWRFKPLGYHLTNVLLHTVNCVLLYFFAFRLFRSTRGALFCAALFAAHPIHVEAVTWAKARSTLLAFMFMFVCVHLYARWALCRATRGSGVLLVCAVLALGMAAVSKASAVMLPPMLALYIWCVTPRPRLRRALFGLIPLLGVVAAFFAFDSIIPKQIFPPTMTLYHHVLTATSAFGFYLRLLVAPVGLCAHHLFSIVSDPAAPQLLRSLPWIIAVLGGTVFALRRSRTAFFSLAWLLIASAPMSSLVFVGRAIGEQRAYAPSVGLCLLLAFLLLRLPRLATGATVRRALEKLAMGLCAMLVVTYAGLTITRNMDWGSAFALWLDTVKKNPTSDSAQGCLARIYVDAAKSEAAEGDLQAASNHRREAKKHLDALLEISPGDRWALDQLAVLCDDMGLYDDAIRTYERLLALSPSNAAAHLGLGIAYAHSGKLAEAVLCFERACRMAPDYAEAFYNLGIFHNRAGDYAKAIPPLERAVALEPGNAAHRRGLGEAYERTERHDRALVEYNASLALWPDDPYTWLATARCHEALGNTEEAIRRYRRCLQAGGPFAELARERLRHLTAGSTE